MRQGALVAGSALVLVGLVGACDGDRPAPGNDPMTMESAPPTTRGVPGPTHPPPAGFPTGTYTRTITDPPTELPQLAGTWTLVLNDDGTFELNGPFATRGRYTVKGGRVTFENDEACPEGTVGVYGWSAAEGSTLRFQAVNDACGPSRQHHLGGGPWTKQP